MTPLRARCLDAGTTEYVVEDRQTHKFAGSLGPSRGGGASWRARAKPPPGNGFIQAFLKTAITSVCRENRAPKKPQKSVSGKRKRSAPTRTGSMRASNVPSAILV